MTADSTPADSTPIEEKVARLRSQGVEIPAPHTLEIGDAVPLEQITGPGTVLHMGTKLYGSRVMILPGTRIGYEEPATVEDCAVGHDCRLGGGYFSNAVLLDGVTLGKGAHVRVGTLMEEQSNAAHTVGLKQTVLLPFVTLGSLINFCDVLMAGGTSRRDHSEVGSSFIHFNFTPFGRNGDKATPSLMGDVPRGVMLQSPRIFLGGQGGLVGPMCVEYGTVLAAGFVYRRDHGPDELVVGEKLVTRSMPFSPLRYGRIRDKVSRNLTYIGNLVALWHWYDQVRIPAAVTPQHAALYRRAQEAIQDGVEERIKRLAQVAGYMEESIGQLQQDDAPSAPEIEAQAQLRDGWAAVEHGLRAFRDIRGDAGLRDALLSSAAFGEAYLSMIGSLGENQRAMGTRWLQSIVTAVVSLNPRAKKAAPGD